MKISTKIVLATTLTLLPFAPELKLSSNQAANDKIPFLKESLQDGNHNSKMSLSDLLTHFKMMNLAHAGGSILTQHPINNLRDSIGLAMGYGDNISYGDLACGGTHPAAKTDCSDAPPYDGIVGRLTTIINTLPTIGKSAGITECTSVPSTGSITGTDSSNNTITVNFKTPTHKVPSPWIGGGVTFQKRVEFQETILGDVTKIAYEFNCGDSAAIYAAINMDMGTNNSYAYTRLITLYTGPVTTTKNGIEVYMAEYSSASSRLRSADAIRVEYTPTTNDFNLWGVMNTNVSGGVQIVTRSVIHGNYSTGAATVLYNGYEAPTLSGNDGPIDITTVNGAGAFATATGLTNGTGSTADYDFNQDLATAAVHTTPGQVYKKGCVNFLSPNTAPTSGADCTGLALSTMSVAPYVDSTGDFSIHWALATMPSKLEVIP